jgi:hypothetical protein
MERDVTPLFLTPRSSASSIATKSLPSISRSTTPAAMAVDKNDVYSPTAGWYRRPIVYRFETSHSSVVEPSAVNRSEPSSSPNPSGVTQSRNASASRPGARTRVNEAMGRYPSDKPVRVAWVDQGGQVRCVPGRCIDVSNRRIHVEVPVQIPLRTPVMLRTEGISIAGSASVRYVTACGDTRFILVLEIG